MIWETIGYCLKPMHRVKTFIKYGKFYFVYWDEIHGILELELFSKHIVYLYIP
jgi:hypothetical protein